MVVGILVYQQTDKVGPTLVVTRVGDPEIGPHGTIRQMGKIPVGAQLIAGFVRPQWLWGALQDGAVTITTGIAR